MIALSSLPLIVKVTKVSIRILTKPRFSSYISSTTFTLQINYLAHLSVILCEIKCQNYELGLTSG